MLSKQKFYSAILCWMFVTTAGAAPNAQADEPGADESGADEPRAVESWADDRLRMTDGLVLWLDAAALDAETLKPGEAVATWPNAIGDMPDLVQTDAEAQPTFHPTGDFRALRFDGEDDHLRSSAPLASPESMTVFVVAAPYSSPGPFSAFLSTSATGKNDYQTGINLDLSVGYPPRFEVLNVEGQGSPGARDLMLESLPYGSVARICVTSTPGKNGVSLWINGSEQESRDRAANGEPIRLEEVIVGARYYAHGGVPHPQNSFDGDIAEVLIFDRALSDEDRAMVDKYLETKYGSIEPLPVPGSAEGSKPLVRVTDPPPVQVLVPGFSVRELPVDLTNINNVQYRDDGVLIALAYDGRIWQLRDTDGDGVEDKASIFWHNEKNVRSAVGMDLTPPGYVHGNGVFFTSKSQCLLVVDTDGDEVADKEIEVAGGWEESPHGVDALGVAFNPRDGSVYYGRGTNNFTEPFLRDKEGHPTYTLEKESGVIIRVAPDFQSREIYATGIRFPVAIRFNRHGDLFCTDQEGATWVPNGNPMDELLHVRPGRHYGFPPRHPTHLPNVIDEPSTFDYGPQHQSTCGFCFNYPVADGGPTFGPAAWEGDAFVTGYSRGKLYRTELVKTARGYVARNQIFACLAMLTSDCCVGTDGSLVVACHSGGPDWGSGPTGRGKLYKITYTGEQLAQPALAWPATERELRIEFDRPLNPELLHNVLQQTEITAGEFVRAGDRYETLWPGYAAVHAQHRAPRRDVRVHSAQLTPDRRTLVLATDPMTAAVHYAVTLPGMGRPERQDTGAQDTGTRGTGAELPQDARVDIDFDLSGVSASWGRDGKTIWSGWLPSLDLAVSRAWTEGSAHHDLLWKAMEESGELTLHAKLNLTDMLRPAVQPGSTLDYELPAEQVSIGYESSAGVSVVAPESTMARAEQSDGLTSGTLRYEPQRGVLVPIEFRLSKQDGSPGLEFTVFYSTSEDDSQRPLQPHRAMLPWSEVPGERTEPAVRTLAEELEGGSWARGRQVFYGEKAGCAKCHTVNRHGSNIGPDLTNLIHRDYASVMRDIVDPSFAINPDYIASTLLLADGRIVSGIVKEEEDQYSVSGTDGKTIVVQKADVEQLRTSPVSIMPKEILKTLDPDQTRDLLTFLLGPAPSMPRDYGGPRPVARPVAEVTSVLAGAPDPPSATRPIHIVLVAGPKDHGPGEHDYPAWQTAWKELLSATDDTRVSTAWEWPTPEQFQSADVVVFYQHGDWNASRAADVDRYLARGGGLVYIHWAVDGQRNGKEFAERIGLAGGGLIGFRHGEVLLSMNERVAHPVLRNFSKLALTDETYWNLTGDLAEDRVLATAVEDGMPRPQVWSLEPGPGRVFVSIPGHYSWTFDDPLFRVLLFRGIAWAAKEPVDRFNALVWPGAHVAR